MPKAYFTVKFLIVIQVSLILFYFPMNYDKAIPVKSYTLHHVLLLTIHIHYLNFANHFHQKLIYSEIDFFILSIMPCYIP